MKTNREILGNYFLEHFKGLMVLSNMIAADYPSAGIDPEELLQNTFLNLLKTYGKQDANPLIENKIHPLVSTVIRNTANNMSRHTLGENYNKPQYSRYNSRKAGNNSNDRHYSGGATSIRRVEQKDDIEFIKRLVMETQKPKRAKAFVESIIEDRDNGELAKEMGIKRKSITSLASLARTQLKDTLGPSAVNAFFIG